MGSIIAISNQKGGVGKTTSCVNIAAGLTMLERRVLLVDLDPQGNATMGSGIDKNEIVNTVTEALLDEVTVNDVLLTTSCGYDILPASKALTIAEVKLLDMPRRELRLRQLLLRLRDAYDYVLIDCPPTLNMLTVNALVAADGVIIPMQCEYYALEGLTDLLDTIEQITKHQNHNLQITGILMTMYDGRSCLTQDVAAQLREHFGDKVFATSIPRNIRLAEAPSYGLPALLYDKRSTGAQAYLALANELIARPLNRFVKNTDEQTTVS